MKNYQLALALVADGSAAAFAFTMPRTVNEYIQLVFLILSLISLILSFIIKICAIVDKKREKQISDTQATVEAANEAIAKIEEAKEIMNAYTSGKYRIKEEKKR